jgi:hypothetical protein
LAEAAFPRKETVCYYTTLAEKRLSKKNEEEIKQNKRPKKRPEKTPEYHGADKTSVVGGWVRGQKSDRTKKTVLLNPPYRETPKTKIALKSRKIRHCVPPPDFCCKRPSTCFFVSFF